MRYVYLVTDTDTQGETIVVIACEREDDAKEIAQRMGGDVDAVPLVSDHDE